MIRSNKIVLISFLLLFGSLSAQYKSNALKRAQSLEHNQKIYEAIDAYEEVLIENPTLEKVRYKLIQLYSRYNDFSSAEKHIKALLNDSLQNFPLLELDYAKLLQKKGDYQRAIHTLETFLSNYKGSDKYFLEKDLKIDIEFLNKISKSAIDSSLKMRSLAEVNSIYSDLSPFVKNDVLYFVSIPSDTALTYLDDIGQEQFLGIYSVPYDTKNDTAIGTPQRFGNPSWQGGKEQISSFTFSNDGQRIYFSKCLTNMQGKNQCNLYAAQKNNNKWGAALMLPSPINSSEGKFSSIHPSIGKAKRKNKDLIFYASNSSSGNGGYDLYAVEIDRKLKPGKPKNLGKKINSKANELSPSYNFSDQSLVFSTDKAGGFGGYDLFKSNPKGRRFEAPKRLDQPLNSAADDLFFHSYEEGKYLIISNRNGAKKYYKDYLLDDIFMLTQGNKHFIQLETYVQDSVLVKNDTATILFNGPKGNQLLISGTVFEAELDLVYRFKTKLDGYINASTNVIIKEDSPDTTIVKMVVEPIVEEKEIRLNNIYFAFASSELNDTSRIEIDSLHIIMSNNPQFKIEIGAHTDNKGRAKYNLELSQKRAQSVVDYLLSKGIDTTRLVAKGYGMSKPIAPNSNSDGSDNPEGRQLNRRIVFKIIGLIPDTTAGTSKYTIKNEKVSNSEAIDSSVSHTGSFKVDSSSIQSTRITRIDSLSPPKGQIPIDSLTSIITKIEDTLSNETTIDSVLVVNPVDSVSKTAAEEEKEQFVSSPIDASVTKNRFRWMKLTGAQYMSCKQEIELKKIRIIAKKKTGVELKIRVVKAKNGKTVAESEVFSFAKNKAASAKAFSLEDLDLSIKLEKGNYFIYPVISKGEIGFLGNYKKENKFKGDAVVIAGVMFNNQIREKSKYKFKYKELKSGRLKNYGPFFRFVFEIPEVPIKK